MATEGFMIGRVFEAASVILLRRACQAPATHAQTYQVLMVGRPVTAQAFAERVVFPGGKVEKSDGQLNQIDTEAKPFPSRFHVCAIRELFEETGVLLTEPDLKLSEEDVVHWRRRVLMSADSFNDMMATFKCQASVSKLKPWSHWITPATGNHRFNTWFFVAEAPEDTKASVFPGEMELTDISWRTPLQTLNAYRSRQIQLAPPQIYTLEQLCALNTVEDVVKNIPKPQSIKEYLPKVQRKQEEGVYTILLPGDKDYEERKKQISTELHRVEIHSNPELTRVYGAVNTR